MNVRFAGMLIAIGVSFATVFLPIGVNDTGLRFLDLTALGLIGAPVAALLAWWLTPTVASGSWRHAVGIGLAMGFAAAYLGVLEVAYLSFVEALAGSGKGFIAAYFVAMYGLPYGTVVLPLTIPCGLIWTLIVRVLLRRSTRATDIGPSQLGVAHVLVLLAVIAVGAALVPVAQSRYPDDDDHGATAPSSAAATAMNSGSAGSTTNSHDAIRAVPLGPANE